MRMIWFSLAVAMALVGFALARLAMAPRSPSLQRGGPSATAPIAAAKASATPLGMVHIPAGTFWMGDAQFPDAVPIHQVRLDDFWIDRTEVTNADFARFVAATGYVTVAEKKPDPQQFPGVPAENLVAGSLVFTPPDHPVPLDHYQAWWRYVPGADWRHPLGPGSSISGHDRDPVVQVAFADAQAYAVWAGKQLPTEAQFEYAARGGLDRAEFVWGSTLKPNGRSMANTFQGHFPDQNTAEDGYAGIAPVGSFPANGFGLFDMAGNVWEWCLDWYQPTYFSSSVAMNPMGPTCSVDPAEPDIPKRVRKGGSFLCNDEYCGRFRPGARDKSDPDSSTNHAGFRCVINTKPSDAPAR